MLKQAGFRPAVFLALLVLPLAAVLAQAEYEMWPGPDDYPPGGLDSVRMAVSFDLTVDPGTGDELAVFSFRNVSTDPTARIHKIGLEGGPYLDDIDHIDSWGQADFKDKNSAIGGYTYDFGVSSRTGTEDSTLGPVPTQPGDRVDVYFTLTDEGKNTFSGGAHDIYDWLAVMEHEQGIAENRFGFQAISVDALNGESISCHEWKTPELPAVFLLGAAGMVLATLRRRHG